MPDGSPAAAMLEEGASLVGLAGVAADIELERAPPAGRCGARAHASELLRGQPTT